MGNFVEINAISCKLTNTCSAVIFFHMCRPLTLGGGGGTQVQRGGGGGCIRVTYFAEDGVFFKTSACPRFCKRRVLFFVPRYEVWGGGGGGGVKIPLQSTKYTRL